MLAGDWTTFASPACNGGVQRTLRAPYVNGGVSPSGTIFTINPAFYSKIALAIVEPSGYAENVGSLRQADLGKSVVD